MRKKIADSTALRPLGNPGQTKLMTIPAGEFGARRVALHQSSSSDIVLTHSDSPSQTWSNARTVGNDAANQAFDCVMTATGDIQLVYIEKTTSHLVTRRLAFADGDWTAGSPVTIYDGADALDPSITVDRLGTLWVSWSRYVTPVRYIHVKASNDNGATWGTGSTDAGTQLAGAATFLYSVLVADPRQINLIYADQDTGIYLRTLLLGGSTWSDARLIAAGSHFSANFDAAVSEAGHLGVVFDNQGLFFREFDGNLWSEMLELEVLPVACPQLRYRYHTPVITYLKPFAGALAIPMVTFRPSGQFTSPTPLDKALNAFDGVMLYNQSADTTVDRTAEAESPTTADVVHPEFGCLLRDFGDCAYLGMDAPFRFVHGALSTAGVGGTVAFAYWNGTDWVTFAPVSSATNLTAISNSILLWTDASSMPDDWQRSVVHGASYYWLRLQVTSDYTIGPVASQVSAAAPSDRLILSR